MWKKCSVTDSEIVFVLQITECVRNIQYSVINLCQPPQTHYQYRWHPESRARMPWTERMALHEGVVGTFR